LQTFEQVPQQPNSVPVSWVGTDHELVIDLDAADFTHPRGPVVEIRLLQLVGGQCPLKERSQRVAIAAGGQRDSGRPDNHPGRNVTGTTGVPQSAQLLGAQPLGRARSCIEAEKVDRLATGQRGVFVGVSVRGHEEMIKEARPLVLGERRPVGDKSAPRPHGGQVSQRGRDYPGERPRDQVGQLALVNSRAQRVPVDLDEPPQTRTDCGGSLSPPPVTPDTKDPTGTLLMTFLIGIPP
jgi:hypothetical protein